MFLAGEQRAGGGEREPASGERGRSFVGFPLPAPRLPLALQVAHNVRIRTFRMSPKTTLSVMLFVLSVAYHKQPSMTRENQQYDVVQEGQTTGASSTINAPGETPPPVTTTAADTTTNFTLPTGQTAVASPNSLGGTLPPTDSSMPSATPGLYVPAPANVPPGTIQIRRHNPQQPTYIPQQQQPYVTPSEGRRPIPRTAPVVPQPAPTRPPESEQPTTTTQPPPDSTDTAAATDTSSSSTSTSTVGDKKKQTRPKTDTAPPPPPPTTTDTVGRQ